MKFFAFLSFFLFATVALNGQVIEEKIVQFDKKNTYNSLSISIDADYENVADSWEDFWQERYDVDFDRLDKGKASIAFLAEQASMSLISDKNANYYSKIAGTTTSSTVSLAIAFTENDIVSPRAHPRAYQAAEVIMRAFRTHFYTSFFGAQLAELKEQLADVRDDSSDATEDAEKARKKIKKYEAKIEKFRRKIEDEREAVGDELETAEEKALKAGELERKIQEVERLRAKYLQ